MVRVPTHREPTHPGEMLIEEFLVPMGLTQRELANSIHVPYQRVNEIINKRRGPVSLFINFVLTIDVTRHIIQV
jgi:plasmid maintenance system antidote protein VapI